MEVVFPSEEEFVVVGVAVWSCGDYSAESPVSEFRRCVGVVLIDMKKNKLLS